MLEISDFSNNQTKNYVRLKSENVMKFSKFFTIYFSLDQAWAKLVPNTKFASKTALPTFDINLGFFTPSIC